jgi:UDP-N-acetylmuramate--alanine ligase
MRDWKSVRAHFVGIGGAGMSGIARIMSKRGAIVSGSDLHESSATSSLREVGIPVSIGHFSENIAECNLIIRSAAIPESNIEIQEGIKRGISILSRASALAELILGKRSVAVAGTHGKTTTTSMLTVALQHCGLDPSFAIGATMKNSATNAHQGSGDIFVVEADESDGSLVLYKPFGAIITNIELDHVDNFDSLHSVDDIFERFANTVAPGGFLVLCIDDPGVCRLIEKLKGCAEFTLLTYGSEASADYRIDRVVIDGQKVSARITQKGRVLGILELAVPGRHNLWNAVAALAAGIELGANPAEMLAGLAQFSGARRRFEVKGVAQGVTVIDDYGHHPTEIAVTIATARTLVEAGRVLVIFQPHRYTRTKVFVNEFATALSQADHTFLLEIYPAGEKPIPGVDSSLIQTRMPLNKAEYEPSMISIIDKVASFARAGDIIITMGAGDVTNLGKIILNTIEEKSMDRE